MDHPSALSYESRIPGAILADETILWVRQPIAPEPIPYIKGSIAVVSIIAFMTGFAALFTRQAFAIVSCGIIATAVAILAALMSLSDAINRRRKLARSTFRVTDRRFLRVEERAGGRCDEMPIGALAEFEFEGGERGVTARFSQQDSETPAVEFGGLEQREVLERHIISQHLASRRRPTIRRTRAGQRIMINATPITETPPWLTLGGDERLIWTGRPEPWRCTRSFVVSRLIILAWLIVPVCVLAMAAGVSNPLTDNVPWFMTLPATVWMLIGLHAIFIKPIRAARRMRRTSYALTNARAVIHEAGRRMRTQSFLLDMAETAALASGDDTGGRGTVAVSVGAEFENIADASRVYTIVLDAIRDSGGTSGATPPPVVSDAAGS